MSKVIIFSQVFPKYHPKAGQPTGFIEKIFNLIYKENTEMFFDNKLPIWLDPRIIETKHHTIRTGNRWKVGDKFSPRVWSEKPYNSKQIIIAPDLEVKKVYDIMIYPNNEIHINGVHFATFGSENCQLIAKNDGLEMNDFVNWFSKLPFKGQIICWSDTSYD
jgi:hypothetical protein